MKEKVSDEFLEILNNVTNKRAKFVIDTILEKGFCSTEDIKNAGYEHPPRAARDVRELGIPLVTGKTKDSTGKNIASYSFGSWEEAKRKNQLAKSGGRNQITLNLKRALLKRYGAKCHLYGERYDERLLQPDHRIPYEIGGDPENMMDTDYFMLLCPSANRDKSWACEHCSNWETKDISKCRTCYYAFPEKYTHIACEEERRVTLILKGKDIDLYNELEIIGKKEGMSNQEVVKRLLTYGVKKLQEK